MLTICEIRIVAATICIFKIVNLRLFLVFPSNSRICQNAIFLDISGKRHIIYLYCGLCFLCWLVLILHALHNICRGSHQVLWCVFVSFLLQIEDCQTASVQMSNAAQLKASWMKSVVNCRVQNYIFSSSSFGFVSDMTHSHICFILSRHRRCLCGCIGFMGRL